MQVTTHAFVAMTTPCQLTLHGAPAGLARTIEAEVRRLEQRYNFHDPASWLNRVINTRQTSEVELDMETARVLHRVRTLSTWCQGAFDITVGTLAALRLVRDPEHYRQGHAALQAAMGLDAWQLSDRQLKLPHAATRLDLGGVIKEHAVDVAVTLAKQAGVAAGIVNFGGDLRVFGQPPDSDCFTIGIENPRQPSEVLFGLTLYDQALASSGHHARRNVLGGASRSHIQPTQGDTLPGWLQASVIAADTLTAGLLATALLVKPLQTLPPDCAAVLVAEDLTLHPLGSTA
ncbi:thiamine biosynthesis lipoprotein [Chitinivorax tropicus]|uniref:FAD:protein FMN transferase n=1 Tax=Chitinivorax tropicus TaxID=714531 RepID=A0A840MHY1_9PROT|nr:FAD:protein FMN transferase [Chitinivorax tropicus]MBB5016799.1 thiamine biosynthesis lipoprotein [Chitinivorax tropicus]